MSTHQLLRLRFLIPALLIVTASIGALLVGAESVSARRGLIQKEGRDRLSNLMAQLQNALSNDMVGGNLPNANISLSHAALNPSIKVLILSDDQHRVLLANRYIWRKQEASSFSRYDPRLAAESQKSHQSKMIPLAEGVLLGGYYPVSLSLEANRLRPTRWGTLYVEYDLSEQLALARQQAIKEGLQFWGLTILLAFMLAAILHWGISRRLEKLGRAAVRLASGDAGSRAGLKGRDEVAALGNAFDEMASKLEADREALRASEKHFRAYFERSMVGMATTSLRKGWLEVNDALCEMLGYSRAELTRMTWAELTHPDDLAADVTQFNRMLGGEVDGYVMDKRFIRKDGRVVHTHLAVCGVTENDNKIAYVAALVEDITERVDALVKVKRLSKLYQALSEIDQAIVRMEQQAELFPLVCKIAVEFGGMKMAWVGKSDETSGLIVPAASYGSGVEYLDGIVISPAADVPEGYGPTGTALRENRPVVINDFSANSSTSPWRERAANFGLGSSAAFPIARGGKPYAVLTVYHEQIGAFDGEAVALLEGMSKDIAFAIDNFDREVQRKSAEESTRLASLVYQNSSEAMMVTDANDAIIAINPAFSELTGYTLDEVIGKNHNLLRSGHQESPGIYQAMGHAIDATGRWQGEIWNKRKNGEVYAELLTVNTIFNEDGSVHRRVALFSDITKKKEFEELIWKQANFDPLTGLPNRSMFHDRLGQEIKKSHRAGLPLALLFIDLDRFKEVNDTLGHTMGDTLLLEAAARITACVRESDTVARQGGDEFTVILAEAEDASTIERVAQAIILRLSQPFQVANEVIYISASIGIALYPNDAADAEQLLRNADQAMYAAKNAGRSRFSYFTGEMQAAAQRRLRMLSDLRNALAGDQFRLHFQPIVDLATGRVNKAEALLRWQHPKKGMISPAEFIPLAEETGLIVEIGDWVFRESARQVKNWRVSYGAEFQIGVNMSPVQFRAATEPGIWLEHLREHGLSGQNIVVEITEGLLLGPDPDVVSQLLQFRDAGIQVALDDFGTGYSTLSYLNKFDIDYLKIDQSFTRNLAPGSSDMALSEAIIVMAHKLGLKVIAEGVETAEQRDLLVAAGCDYAQGYLFSRPVPPEEFEAFLGAS